MPDIDIDFFDRSTALSKMKHVTAAIRNENTFKRHNTGIYCQYIPHNPVSGVSTIDYKEAEDRGYFKIDFLNVNIYKDIKDNNHLLHLMETEPIWELLIQEDFVNLLFHINGHTDILKQMQPTSVEQLAAVLAMIRPAKRYLIGKEWTTVMNEIWEHTDVDAGYSFRKSHAIAYAMAIVVQMNLICEQN
jgi:DNA polymerase III alpha subunit